MNTNKKAKILRIYLSSTDKFKHVPLYEVIVYAAKRQQIEGATVLRGYMGYGISSNKITSLKYWEITEKVPLVIEIVDEAEKIEKFINYIEPFFYKIKHGCMITIHEVTVLLQKTGNKNK